MKIELRGEYSEESPELVEIQNVLKGSWSAACEDYAARHWVCESLNQKTPLGVQPFLNSVLNRRFQDAQWDGRDGRFTKSDTWFRVTFRHQMSLGSDFIDGLLLARREGIRQIVVAAAAEDFAKIITPRDAKSIVTFEKLDSYYVRAKSLFPIDLAIGRLSVLENPRDEVQSLILTRQ